MRPNTPSWAGLNGPLPRSGVATGTQLGFDRVHIIRSGVWRTISELSASAYPEHYDPPRRQCIRQPWRSSRRVQGPATTRRASWFDLYERSMCLRGTPRHRGPSIFWFRSLRLSPHSSLPKPMKFKPTPAGLLSPVNLSHKHQPFCIVILPGYLWKPISNHKEWLILM